MMSAQLTPSKRPSDQNVNESNGKGKLQKTQNPHDQNLGSSLGNVYFRVLCSTSDIESLIGEDGGAIARIGEETGLSVRVDEPAAGCDDRVVVIESSLQETEGGENSGSKMGEGNGEANAAAAERKEAFGVDTSKSVNGDSAVRALLLIFERLAEAESGKDGGDDGNGKPASSLFVLRLLVLASQVGTLLGKGGSLIKLMASESGAQIRILPKDKLPKCASAQDDTVQITGEVDAVRRALHSVSRQLLGNTVKYHKLVPATSVGFSSQPLDNTRPRIEFHPPANHPYISRGLPNPPGPPEPVLTFRLLCPEEKAGGVIGKGGSIIRGLQQETGCEMRVMEPVLDCGDRVIIVSGSVEPKGRISAVQDAVLRVHDRMLKLANDNKEKTVVARLLVSSNQLGCLIGIGGSIMAEMKKSTGAYIRILPKDQIPNCATEGEDVVQINGEAETVQEALVQITTRLQQHVFRDAFPSAGHPTANPSFLDHPRPPFPLYPGRREHSPSFHLFNNGMVGTHHQRLGFPPIDDHSPFTHDIHRPGMPPHLYERKPWGPPQGLPEGGAPVGFPDFPAPPHRRMPGLGGSHAPVITNTKLEVIVPRSIVPIIYGEDGACLMQIRQISEAQVTILDPKPGATETVIVISGTPEQANAAQSLIQAFVMSEHESA